MKTAMKQYSFQGATIPYLGSKIKQSATLASFIDPAKHKVLISPFCGGCSLELFVKHKLSLKTISNDWSLVSFVCQKSLLENNHSKIELHDICSLFQENLNDGFVRKNYSKFFTDQVCDFLDTASENIRQMPEGVKKYQLSHLLVYYILHTLPYGKFGCTADIRCVRENGLNMALEEAVKTSDSRGSKLLKSAQHPLIVLKKLAKKINAGVINNSKTNAAHYGDAFEFLSKTKELGNEAVMFADPPYFASTSYDMYRPINEILLGRKEEKHDSVFNSKEVHDWYERFFQEAQHLDLWIITMGAKVDEPNAIHAEEFLEMVRKHRPNAKLIKFENFRWSINTLSGKSPKLCEEYAVIAEK